MDKGGVGSSYIVSREKHGFAAAFELMAEISGAPAPKLRFSPRFHARFWLDEIE